MLWGKEPEHRAKHGRSRRQSWPFLFCRKKKNSAPSTLNFKSRSQPICVWPACCCEGISFPLTANYTQICEEMIRVLTARWWALVLWQCSPWSGSSHWVKDWRGVLQARSAAVNIISIFLASRMLICRFDHKLIFREFFEICDLQGEDYFWYLLVTQLI